MGEKRLATLVIAQHDNQTVSVDTLRTLTAATAVHNNTEIANITVLVMGYECDGVAKQLASIDAIEQVVIADSALYQHPVAESCADLIVQLCKKGSYSHILAPATTFGKNIMPRVAALLDVGQLSDVIEIETPDTVIRPIYAGNALARVKSHDVIKILTIRGAAFDAIKLGSKSDTSVISIDFTVVAQNVEFISQQKVESIRPELPAANVVISGGRGVGSKENFSLVEQLADKLGGAIGASRAAVDAGFVSNDLQVGQTGKIVAPDLYIAVGISGAIQHLAGMKDSKVIVAINSDAEAPIFQIADYGLVGDLFDIMPELIDAL